MGGVSGQQTETRLSRVVCIFKKIMGCNYNKLTFGYI